MSQVERRDRQVVDEGRVVRARPERADAEAALPHLGGVGLARRVLQRPVPLRLQRALPRGGIWQIAGQLPHERLQGVRPAASEPSPAVGVRVHVGHRVPRQSVPVVLRPLGRPQESPLLAVPQREHDRAAGLPPGATELRQRPCRFQQGDRAGGGVVGAVHPGVVVVALHHELVPRVRPGDLGHHVVQRSVGPLELQVHANPCGAGTDVVGDREPAFPVVVGGHRSPEGPQQRHRVAPRHGEDGNRHQGGRLRRVQPPPARRGPPSGAERIAGVGGHVHHAATLRAPLWAHGAGGIGIVHVEPVVFGVGVDDGGDRAALRRHLGLDASPAATVLGDHHLAAHVHAHGLEPVVVFRKPVVDEDQLTGNVAVGRVGVEQGELPVVVGVLVAVHRRFLQPGDVSLGRDQLDVPCHRHRHVRLELLDPGVEAPRPEALQGVLCHGPRPRAAGVVGLLGHRQEVFPQQRGVGRRPQCLLESSPVRQLVGGEAADGRGLGPRLSNEADEGEKQDRTGERREPHGEPPLEWDAVRGREPTPAPHRRPEPSFPDRARASGHARPPRSCF